MYYENMNIQSCYGYRESMRMFIYIIYQIYSLDL